MRSPVAMVVASVLLASCTRSSNEMYDTERVYHGSAGWSVEVPAGWRVLPFNMSKGDVSVRGAQISNVKLPPPEIQPGLPIQTSGLVLPPDGVSLVIAADLDPNIPHIFPSRTTRPKGVRPRGLDDLEPAGRRQHDRDGESAIALGRSPALRPRACGWISEARGSVRSCLRDVADPRPRTVRLAGPGQRRLGHVSDMRLVLHHLALSDLHGRHDAGTDPRSRDLLLPVVDDDGTVYYGVSGRRCGQNVRLMRHVSGANRSTEIRSFPDGIDVFPGDVFEHDVYFGRYDCERGEGDIYRLTP